MYRIRKNGHADDIGRSSVVGAPKLHTDEIGQFLIVGVLSGKRHAEDIRLFSIVAVLIKNE